MKEIYPIGIMQPPRCSARKRNSLPGTYKAEVDGRCAIHALKSSYGNPPQPELQFQLVDSKGNAFLGE